MKYRPILAASAMVLSIIQHRADANVMQLPTGETSLSFVTIGDPGNAPDSGGRQLGAVNYVYQMGKYDVTNYQYAAFLNSVAATDLYGLYTSFMAGYNGSFPYGINRSGTSGHFIYSVFGDGNVPMFTVNWGQAARFCNWLQNGQPTGSEGVGTTETGAYILNGAVTATALYAITRNEGATYFIPTEDEWYKAAYYIGGSTNAGYWLYPTKSNSTPSNIISSTGTNNADFVTPSFFPDLLTPVGTFAGSPGPYGTFDQGGEVFQWNESKTDVVGPEGGSLGGSWNTQAFTMASTNDGGQNLAISNASNQGFRVASFAAPEPASVVMLAIGAAGLLVLPTRRIAKRRRGGLAPADAE